MGGGGLGLGHGVSRLDGHFLGRGGGNFPLPLAGREGFDGVRLHLFDGGDDGAVGVIRPARLLGGERGGGLGLSRNPSLVDRGLALRRRFGVQGVDFGRQHVRDVAQLVLGRLSLAVRFTPNLPDDSLALQERMPYLCPHARDCSGPGVVRFALRAHDRPRDRLFGLGAEARDFGGSSRCSFGVRR